MPNWASIRPASRPNNEQGEATATTESTGVETTASSRRRPPIIPAGMLVPAIRAATIITNEDGRIDTKEYILKHKMKWRELSPEAYDASPEETAESEELKRGKAVYNSWRDRIMEAGKAGVTQQVKAMAEDHEITVAEQKPADIGDIQYHLSNPDAWKDLDTATKTRQFLYKVKYGYNRDSHWMNRCKERFEREHNVVFERKICESGRSESGRGSSNNAVTTFHRLMMKKKNEVAKRLARTEMKATGTQVRISLERNSQYWTIQRQMPRPLRGEWCRP